MSTPHIALLPADFASVLDADGPLALVASVTPWLARPADVVDRELVDGARESLLKAVTAVNRRAADGDRDAFYAQQLLLSRSYELVTQLPPDAVTAEGSVVVHEMTRLLEEATVAAEERHVDPALLAAAPTEPKAFLSWLREYAKGHRAYKHPYYAEFIRHQATRADLRKYVIQESVVDGRFDDLLAMMQVGTTGAAKMEIAGNYWDEMGNGKPEEVHTHLFNKIYDVFAISSEDLRRELTAEALLSGNLAVLLCRYRRYYPEAIGFLGMTEWFAPDRFVHVVHGWERLGLPEVGITYHKLHITIDSQHAAGWFHNVVVPAADSAFMREGMARGALWRLNSSARYLDERLARTAAAAS
ncbi:iron-containing redox enzyme family protein [Streptomyces gilvosporeus]|uniref:iron-containing redox enzyme family protein n=1 Tax=Streptomyces gilvosporeus TaxID=553510 RepID=UPI001F2C16DD|nr:iron-containing redox enzyme family protein [Streptomyces gilvosporeus]